MNHSEVHPASASLAHLIDLFLFQGAPRNANAGHPVKMLVNHGYVAGYAPTRLQPLWSAYRVAHADLWVDYDRPHVYYADKRLDPAERLGPETFGSHEGIQYHVGHMVPNEVVNQQFGRLAQLETFFMSNMSPQRGSLNTGVWLKLEDAIRNIQDTNQKDHVWVISGPVFDDAPKRITRPDGKEVPIPVAYFCITVDPFRYPWNEQANVDIACFLIPQDAPRGESPARYLVDLREVQDATGLTFMPGWDVDIGECVGLGDADDRWTRHRLLKQFA